MTPAFTHFLQALSAWLPTLALLTLTAVMVWRDPRRMRCAVFLGLSLLAAYLAIQTRIVDWVDWADPQAAPWVVLAAVALVVVVVLAAAVFLIWAGVVLLEREGVSLAHLLSLALGVGVLVYVAVGLIAVASDNVTAATYLLMLIFPMFTFGFTLFSYLLYSALYGFWARRWAPAGQVVVVLGSGLLGDRVSPLLARRLDLGVEMFSKSLLTWPRPLLVVSGGKGSDEQVAEAEAMGAYVLNLDFDLGAGELLEEPQSASTEENLAFTGVLVRGRGVEGPWMVVTSDFHAFRAALLLAEQGQAGNAVGAHSPRYFWASAKLREFIAILASRPRGTVAAVATSLLPLAYMTAVRALTLLG